ncbi:AAA family ATPase [Rapidithrix thailandica]|uniref:AAA family ATPase n=1 Tax=Rapidithrix thailandica TaxID=413964 RepID=A0AAW9S6L8_9BACT
MKKVLILKGLPGSGKSTFAKKLLEDNPGMYKRLNRDELRVMLDNNHFTPKNEKFVQKVRDLIFLEALKEGKHVIVDDTNLAPQAEERVRQLVAEYCHASGQQVFIEVKEMDTPLQECLERDAKREKKVGRDVIMKMYNQHVLKNDRGPNYQPQNPALPPAIICDLDGTLAILKRSPFNALACEKDLLNEPVAELVKSYSRMGTKILLMSGREETAREQTQRWLAKYDIPYDGLFMRKEKDMRKDAVVKKELFEQHVQNQYFVRFVLDDRNQVVDLWRMELGLPCLQVNYGDF